MRLWMYPVGFYLAAVIGVDLALLIMAIRGLLSRWKLSLHIVSEEVLQAHLGDDLAVRKGLWGNK